VLARIPGAPDGYDLALASTDLDATPAQLVEWYAARWAVRLAATQDVLFNRCATSR
jgi:hypothetical protein